MADNDDKILKILESMDKRLDGLEKNTATKSDLTSAKTELKQAIVDSQEATIAAVTDYINTGYIMLDKRIEKIEDALDLPHPDNN